jgi:hypothetical protein
MDEQTIIMLAIIGSVLLISALVLAAFLMRRTVSATIEGFSWLRKVLLEHYIWVHDSSYSGFPAGSRNQQRKIESYQSYERISSSTTTTTVNGVTSTTTQPVYGFVPRWRTKYTYEIQKWLRSRELLAKGEERATLHWPTFVLDHSTLERVEKTEEKYLVFFRTTKGKIYRRKLTAADWVALDETSTYILSVNLFGRVRHMSAGTEQIATMPRQTF